MRVEGDLVWWSPVRRAVIPVAGFRASRSLRRAARGYEIRVDTAFADVIQRLRRPARGRTAGSTPAFVAAYTRLHELGWAHSVEAWDDEGLAGGLYGVACGGLFAAESMFHRRTRRLEGGAPRARRAAPGGRRRPAARRPVGDATPRLARRGRDHAGRVPPAARRRAAAAGRLVGRNPDDRLKPVASPATTAGRCRSSGRSRTGAARARSRRSRRARRPRG